MCHFTYDMKHRDAVFCYKRNISKTLKQTPNKATQNKITKVKLSLSLAVNQYTRSKEDIIHQLLSILGVIKIKRLLTEGFL